MSVRAKFRSTLLVEPRTFNANSFRPDARAGLRAGEVLRLKVKHIDSAQMTHVEQREGPQARLVVAGDAHPPCARGGRCA